jgi:hypothetical protein
MFEKEAKIGRKVRLYNSLEKGAKWQKVRL